jgi:hypothetical protein
MKLFKHFYWRKNERGAPVGICTMFLLLFGSITIDFNGVSKNSPSLSFFFLIYQINGGEEKK